MPLGIKIPGEGPGTGPVIPEALFSLGVDDYTHRFAASRIPGAVGSALTVWPDSVASPSDITNGNSAFVLAETSGSRYVRKVPGVGGAVSNPGPAMPFDSPGTLVMIAYCDPANAIGGTRYIAQGMGFQVGRAGNSSWQASGSGGFGTVGNDDTWGFFAFAHDGSVPFTSGDVTIQRNGSRSTSLSGPVTPTAYSSFQLTALVTLDVGYEHIVYWPRKLSNAELDTVRAAFMANSALV